MIVNDCKKMTYTCYEEYKLLTGPLNCAKYRVQLDKILLSHLVRYAQNNPEMNALIEWMALFQDKILTENMELICQQAQKNANKMH